MITKTEATILRCVSNGYDYWINTSRCSNFRNKDAANRLKDANLLDIVRLDSAMVCIPKGNKWDYKLNESQPV